MTFGLIEADSRLVPIQKHKTFNLLEVENLSEVFVIYSPRKAFAKVKSVSLYSLRQHNCRSENRMKSVAVISTISAPCT